MKYLSLLFLSLALFAQPAVATEKAQQAMIVESVNSSFSKARGQKTFDFYPFDIYYIAMSQHFETSKLPIMNFLDRERSLQLR